MIRRSPGRAGRPYDGPSITHGVTTMKRWTFRIAALAGLALPLAVAAQGLAQTGSRGQMLYGNHCVACHTTQMHWRDKKLVTDWPSLKVQVRRFQGAAQLNWSEEDIDDVARYLNDAFYRLPGGKVALLPPGAPR